MAHDVFVSYSNHDKPIADAVVAGLENHGIRCWFAPRDITPGSSWGESIISAIENSSIMVIILSANSNRSNQVVREVERAVANNVIIIPYRIENIDPTGAMAYFLSTEHWLDAITPPLEEHIQKLIHTVLVFQGKEKPSENQTEVILRPKAQKKFLTKTWMAVLAGLAMIALAIFLLPRIMNSSPKREEDTTPPLVQLTEVLPDVPYHAETAMAGVQPTDTLSLTSQPFLNLVGKYPTSRVAQQVFVQNNTAYLANSEDGLIILDVSDPANPIKIGNYEINNAVSVIVVDDIAYVVEEGQFIDNRITNDQLHLIDVHNPTVPRLISVYPPEGGSMHRSLNNFAVSDKVVYLTLSDKMIAVDVSTPAEPVTMGEFSFSSNVSSPGVFVQDGIAYMQANRLHVVDFREPADPKEIGGFDAGWGSNVKVVDQIAYIAGWDTGLTTLDVSDPSQPIKLGQFKDLIGNYELLPKGSASRQTFLDLSISGEIAYVSYRFGLDQGTWVQVVESGILILDVSDPTKPVMLDKYTEFDEVSYVFATENFVFVTDETRGLFIFSKQQ